MNLELTPWFQFFSWRNHFLLSDTSWLLLIKCFIQQTLSVCCVQEMNSGEVQSSSLHFSGGFMFKRPYSQEKSNFKEWARVHTAGYFVIWEFLQSPFIFPLIHIYFHSLIWNLDFHTEFLNMCAQIYSSQLKASDNALQWRHSLLSKREYDSHQNWCQIVIILYSHNCIIWFFVYTSWPICCGRSH